MRYTERDSKSLEGQLFNSLEPLIRGMKMSLIEINVFRMKARGNKAGGAQLRVIVCKEGLIGLEDCTRVHRSIMPRLELAFPGQVIYLEVSSPGIDRIIKDGREFIHYLGRKVNCYRTDISDWTMGVLLAADERELKLLGANGEIVLPLGIIAKARLSSPQTKPPVQQCGAKQKSSPPGSG